MIEFEGVTLRYAGRPVLRDVTVAVPEGELVLVVGPTGSGKTSLLQCLDTDLTLGAAGPESAALTGRVRVDGTDLHQPDLHPPDRPAQDRPGRRLVGLVRQDPAAHLGTATVEAVIADAVVARPADPHSGQRQVEETLDLLGIADLRGRPVAELSGGQRQRVAIGVALVAGPRLLVLDEPTSALDPVAAEEVLAVLHRLVHDVGTTVVVAEHRLERVVHHADTVLLVDGGRVTGPHQPARAMHLSNLRPPVAELGVRLGWEPLALSVREARRAARPLRTALSDASPVAGRVAASRTRAPGRHSALAPALVTVRRVSIVRAEVVALRDVSLRVDPGEVVALMGRNGAGKSTLLAAMDASLTPTSGRVDVTGPSALSPQDPATLLTATATVASQLTAHDARHRLSPGTSVRVLGLLAPDVRPDDSSPSDLSEGQRMCVALSMVLARESAVVLLDEPTRGLDYEAKARLATALAERAAAGSAVVVATHDVELAAEVATRVVVLAEGEVVADGPATQVLADSPAFAPQVAKVMHPAPFLRVRDVAAAVERLSAG